MNGTSTQVLREHDPKYLKRRRWERRGVILVAFLAVAAVGAAGFAVASAVKVEKRVTRFEQSACANAQSDPTDLAALHECQKVRAAAERTANQNVNCIPFLRAGYACPKPGSPLAEEHRGREIREAVSHHGTPGPTADVTPTQSEAGDATSAPTGHSLPGRHEGGSSATDHPSHPHAPSVPHQSGGGGGSEAAPAPGTPTAPAPTAPTSPGTSSSSTTERTTETVVVEPSPTPEAPVRQGAGVLLESVGGVVEEAGGTVNEVVGGVTETTCSLAKLLCSE